MTSGLKNCQVCAYSIIVCKNMHSFQMLSSGNTFPKREIFYQQHNRKLGNGICSSVKTISPGLELLMNLVIGVVIRIGEGLFLVVELPAHLIEFTVSPI